MFRSSSPNWAPFWSQVHVCQWLRLSLSSLNVLDQIIFFHFLYLLFYLKFICVFFYLCCFFMCFKFCPTLKLIRYKSPKLSYTYSKGFRPGYYGGVSGAGFQHPTGVYRCFKSLYFKETSVWLYWSFLLSFCYCRAASFWEKHPAWSNSVSRAVVYTLWIFCDCTVLHLLITVNYMVLYFWQRLRIH